MTDQTPNTFKGLLSAELAVQLGTLDNFLTALQQPGVNVESAVQDFAKLQVSILSSAPTSEAIGISKTAAIVQTQLNSLASHLSANPVPATSAASPVTAS